MIKTNLSFIFKNYWTDFLFKRIAVYRRLDQYGVILSGKTTP